MSSDKSEVKHRWKQGRGDRVETLVEFEVFCCAIREWSTQKGNIENGAVTKGVATQKPLFFS